MGLLSMLGSALTGNHGGLGGLLGMHSQGPGMVTPPSAGGFNAPGFMPFPGMQTGQSPAPVASGEHPGGFAGFLQQQLGGPSSHTAMPPLQTPDMSHPQGFNLSPGDNQGQPMPGQPLRPINGLQQMSGW